MMQTKTKNHLMADGSITKKHQTITADGYQFVYDKIMTKLATKYVCRVISPRNNVIWAGDIISFDPGMMVGQLLKQLIHLADLVGDGK